MLKRGHKNHPFGLWWLWMKHLKWLQVTAQILSGLLVEEGGGKKGPICHRLTDFFWLKKLAAISVPYILLQYDNCASSIIGKYTCSWLVSCHAHLSLIIKRLLAKKNDFKTSFSLVDKYSSSWRPSILVKLTYLRPGMNGPFISAFQ